MTKKDFGILEKLTPTLLTFPTVFIIGSNKNKEAGCYVFAYFSDNLQYIGRSTTLATRIRDYNIVKLASSNRTVSSLMKKEGLEAFNLYVYVLNTITLGVTRI